MAEPTADELLLADIRNYLDITWEDAEIDKKITGMIQRGITYLNEKAGAELDYSVEGQARSLLFDYVRYARSNALNEFWPDYMSDLIALRLKQGVANYEEENPDV